MCSLAVSLTRSKRTNMKKLFQKNNILLINELLETIFREQFFTSKVIIRNLMLCNEN